MFKTGDWQLATYNCLTDRRKTGFPAVAQSWRQEWLNGLLNTSVSLSANCRIRWRKQRTESNIGREIGDETEERMPVVSLRAVVEALDLESDELRSCLDPDTGEIVTFNAEEARLAESGQWANVPAWMQESLPKVKRALQDDRMLELPDRAHIDEWRMMQDFAAEQEECRCRPELLSAIQGSGAFRNFKQAIERLALENSWYQYRQAAFEQVAREWLERNHIPYR